MWADTAEEGLPLTQLVVDVVLLAWPETGEIVECCVALALVLMIAELACVEDVLEVAWYARLDSTEDDPEVSKDDEEAAVVDADTVIPSPCATKSATPWVEVDEGADVVDRKDEPCHVAFIEPDNIVAELLLERTLDKFCAWDAVVHNASVAQHNHRSGRE